MMRERKKYFYHDIKHLCDAHDSNENTSLPLLHETGRDWTITNVKYSHFHGEASLGQDL